MPPKSVIRTLLLASVSCCCLSIGQARIGDTPRQMDGRILQPDLGRYFSLRGLNERERNQYERDLPVAAFVPYLPPDIREVIYWKSAMRRQLSNDDGWRVHAYFWKDRSVLEAYRRVGESLSEFEINALLSLNRGPQVWEKVDKEKAKDTVIGYDYQLGEDGLRARVQGNWLLIYLTRFDKMLIERKKEQDALDDAEKARKRLEQQQKAPESIEGF